VLVAATRRATRSLGAAKMSAQLRAQVDALNEQKQAAWATKKWTWVIDEKEGCVAAEILKENGNEITVKLNSGQVRCAASIAWIPHDSSRALAPQCMPSPLNRSEWSPRTTSKR